MIFEVSEDVFRLLPNACFGVVAAFGIDNHGTDAAVEALLQEEIAACEEKFQGVKVKEAPEIVPYREAFRSLGINPNKFMCSIEALLTRIAKGKGFPHINPAVDLGNAISLKYQLPIGAHDMATVREALQVRFADGEDRFVPFGSTEEETPEAGEVVYVSDHGVRTRRWTWRQSELGKITEDTRDILFPIDGFTDVNRDRVLAAREDLAARLAELPGVTVKIGIIDRENPRFEA